MNIERIIQIEKFLYPESFGVYKLDKAMKTDKLEIPQDHFLLFDFERKAFAHSADVKESDKVEWKDFPLKDLEELDPEFSVVAVKAV